VQVTEGLLLRSMDALEGLSWKGRKSDSSYPLSWPRSSVVGCDGQSIDDSTVPPQLPLAQMWVAFYIDAGNDPAEVVGSAIRREKVDVLEGEYAVIDGMREIGGVMSLPNVQNALKGLLRTGVGCCRIDRA